MSTTADYKNDAELHARLIAEVLAAYPDKLKKKRQKHLGTATPAGVEHPGIPTGEVAADAANEGGRRTAAPNVTSSRTSNRSRA